MHILLANPHRAYAPRVTIVGLVCVCAVLFCLRNYVDILVALVSRSLRCSFCCLVNHFRTCSIVIFHILTLLDCMCMQIYICIYIVQFHACTLFEGLFAPRVVQYAHHCATLPYHIIIHCISTLGSHCQEQSERGLCDCVTSPAHARPPPILPSFLFRIGHFLVIGKQECCPK